MPIESPLTGCQDSCALILAIGMPEKGDGGSFFRSDSSRMKDRKWASWTHSIAPSTVAPALAVRIVQILLQAPRGIASKKLTLTIVPLHGLSLGDS